ncbi:DUF2789 domain-containing protein [Variovorax sp. HJSM1_2]|uniref:DUF2789 domain-containing protein n=1 Tax=Variovorax sp. HJSM1_2 TaxID=3366263 RepID=UPI003BBF84BC
MDLSTSNMTNLFQQLGLPSKPAEIAQFVAQHRPLADDVKLADAPFWSAGQAQFLREQIQVDADWAEVVDQLSVMLRS